MYMKVKQFKMHPGKLPLKTIQMETVQIYLSNTIKNKCTYTLIQIRRDGLAERFLSHPIWFGILYQDCYLCQEHISYYPSTNITATFSTAK